MLNSEKVKNKLMKGCEEQMKTEHTIKLGVIVKAELGEATISIIDRLLKILENKVTEEPTKEKKNNEEVTKAKAPEEEIEKTVETVETEETEVSLEQLRAELSKIREKGGKDLIKELLEYVGANKLSDVKKDDYGKLMKKIKEVK